MQLMLQYKNVFDLANEIGVTNPDVREEHGKLIIKGQVPYEMDVARLWDAIKSHPNWSTEVVADLRAQHTDVLGVYTVEAGDTLSKIAKRFLGNANRYPEIFEANRAQLSDPNKINVGQKLTIPKA